MITCVTQVPVANTHHRALAMWVVEPATDYYSSSALQATPSSIKPSCRASQANGTPAAEDCSQHAVRNHAACLAKRRHALQLSRYGR